MAEFIYKSTVYGPQVFTVPDKEKCSTPSCGYMTPNSSSSSALQADAASLEIMARSWWKKRNQHLDSFGHKANRVEP